MKKVIVLLLTMLSVFFAGSPAVYSNDSEPDYLQLRSIDAGTFNEYRYLIGQKYLELKKDFSVNNTMGKELIGEIAVLAKKGKNYLPSNLTNDNLYNNLIISLEKGVKQPTNSNNFTAISQNIQAYLESTDIGAITGQISVTPSEGNAPLPVSLRAQVVDPSGSQLYDYNYTWWIDEGGTPKIIGNKPSIIYTFTKQGNFGVFLDVESNHKNSAGYTDVLPLRKKVTVKVNEKIASVILNVNNNKALNNSLVKISPDEAKYGVVFDATSSTPSDGSQFQRTLWDFGNGVKREYRGGPKIERVIYGDKGEYDVTLQLVTNEGVTITRNFDIIVSQPIAEIKASSTSGFLGDKFSFSAKDADKFEGLNYTWEIVDINNEKVIYKRSGTALSYIFPAKGKYNVKLGVGNGTRSDYDTKTIYINSRPPVADFTSIKPDNHKPNKVLLNGTRSYDPDFSDEGRLQYAWFIDGEKVTLDESNESGSLGYYTFDSIGSHSVVLVVVDDDNISHQKQDKVNITSLLSVDFDINPRVIQRDSKATFTASSPLAEVFEWDFGDGTRKSSTSSTISHTYKQSGINNVKLTVRDKENNKTTYVRDIYVGDADAPYAFIEANLKNNSTISYVPNSCFGENAYVVNKVDPVQFSADNSIDVNGASSGLEYTWKLGVDKYFTQKGFSYQFDEIGCFPVKLTVKSIKNGKSHSSNIWVKVENLKPTLNSLNVQVLDQSTDPVIVNVSAQGAQDRDGVIQSYLWYYYTDGDSEPQDFKSTTTPNTTFVLPKVTGNYYFVVVMKDSNEQRINSEEVTGEKFYITLTGDNINTPLIDISVSDSSVEIGEEVVYTVNVENILGQNISNDVEYSWDFDGDGFYEKQSKKPSIAHKFTNSGEFHSKVKVKNKGFSNLKTTTINVANRLVADFDYISIGDKVIFINKSTGEVDKVEWNLGDGNSSTQKNTFTHLYGDSEKKHEVTLNIYEGNQSKKVTKTVNWNPKNILKSRKKDLNVFTYPVEEEGKLQLVNPAENVYIYLAESEDTYEYFAIDYDTAYDSDLNGGLDDDEDNKATGSYNSGTPAKIILNDARVQNIRITGKSGSGETLGVYDLEITKLYISQADESQNNDIESIEFAGVSDGEKVKIEKLKAHLVKLPQEQRVKAMKYLEKLQEEWFDNTEKTRVIVEFEQYIDSTGYAGTTQVYDLLESLLVEGQEDKSEKNITFNALKNLIPENISCETSGDQDCYSSLVEKVEAIRDSSDIEQNKILGSQLLDTILVTDTMTDEQKLNFKQILKPFVYGGLENVPEQEASATNDTDNDSDSSSGGFLSFLKGLLKWIGILLLFIIIAVAGFWIFYKLKNKDDNIGFQDYIIDSTKQSDDSHEKIDVLSDENKDILSEEKIVEPKVEVATKQVEKSEEKLETLEPKKETTQPEIKSDGAVPDWLTGASTVSQSSTQKTDNQVIDQKPIVEKKQEVKVEKQSVKKQDKVGIEKKEAKPEVNTPQELDKITAIEDTSKSTDDNVPDWLKGSIDTTQGTDKKIEKKKETSAPKESKKPEKKATDKKSIQTEPKNTSSSDVKTTSKKPEATTSKEDDNLPDWLKGSMDAPKKEEKPVEKKKNEDKKVDKKVEPKKEAQKPADKKTENQTKKGTQSKADTKKTAAKNSDTNKDKKEVKKDDLWDDGMDVPDWLKGAGDTK